jgi:hypothetical protein
MKIKFLEEKFDDPFLLNLCPKLSTDYIYDIIGWYEERSEFPPASVALNTLTLYPA